MLANLCLQSTVVIEVIVLCSLYIVYTMYCAWNCIFNIPLTLSYWKTKTTMTNCNAVHLFGFVSIWHAGVVTVISLAFCLTHRWDSIIILGPLSTTLGCYSSSSILPRGGHQSKLVTTLWGLIKEPNYNSALLGFGWLVVWMNTKFSHYFIPRFLLTREFSLPWFM